MEFYLYIYTLLAINFFVLLGNPFVREENKPMDGIVPPFHPPQYIRPPLIPNSRPFMSAGSPEESYLDHDSFGTRPNWHQMRPESGYPGMRPNGDSMKPNWYHLKPEGEYPINPAMAAMGFMKQFVNGNYRVVADKIHIDAIPMNNKPQQPPIQLEELLISGGMGPQSVYSLSTESNKPQLSSSHPNYATGMESQLPAVALETLIKEYTDMSSPQNNVDVNHQENVVPFEQLYESYMKMLAEKSKLDNMSASSTPSPTTTGEVDLRTIVTTTEPTTTTATIQNTTTHDVTPEATTSEPEGGANAAFSPFSSSKEGTDTMSLPDSLPPMTSENTDEKLMQSHVLPGFN